MFLQSRANKEHFQTQVIKMIKWSWKNQIENDPVPLEGGGS